MSVRAIAVRFVLFSLLATCGRGQDDEEDPDEDHALTHGLLDKLHGLFDYDKNGKVNLHELMKHQDWINQDIGEKDLEENIEDFDTDKDGKLTLDEFINGIEHDAQNADDEEKKAYEERKIHEAEKFKTADENSDGILEKQEIIALFHPATHDGVLSLTAAAEMKERDHDKDMKLSPKEWVSHGPDDEEFIQDEMVEFRKLDRDKDGFLDLEEVKHWESGRSTVEEAMKMLIDIADKDKDGHVTADELKKARKEIIENHEAQSHLVGWADHRDLHEL